MIINCKEVAKIRKEWGGRLRYDPAKQEIAVSGEYADWLEGKLVEARARVSELERGNDEIGQELVELSEEYSRFEQLVDSVVAERDKLREQKAAFDIRSRWVTEMQQLAHSEGWCRNVTGESMVDFFYRRIDELRGETAGLRKVLEPFVRFYSQFKAVHTNIGSVGCGFVLTPDHIKAAKDAFDDTPDQHRDRIVAAGLRELWDLAESNANGDMVVTWADITDKIKFLECGE